MDWLGLSGKRVAVTGLANKKSVAWHVGVALEEAGATPVWIVHTSERAKDVARLVGERDVLVCDVTRQEELDSLAGSLDRGGPLDGLVHSIAHADYPDGGKPFHHTAREDFLRAVDVSCFSLLALSRALEPVLAPDASVVAISISTTTMAAENYGYMAPIKAALDSAIVFLAKSFKERSRVRFNAVRAGPLKTSASAGIPGYVESYLYAERATLRGRGLATSEVANAALFLLSPRSSGIDAQGIVVDAGMGVNYFDRRIVRAVGRDGESADEGS